MSEVSGSWMPTARLDALRTRARILQKIRAFFSERGYLEVETPALSVAASTDVNLDSFSLEAVGGRRYLHTSPEFPMKRLLAAGTGNIFQLCRVFRAGEAGRWHNPEFTLLEWYRLDCNDRQMMDDIEMLLRSLLATQLQPGPAERYSYQHIFQQALQVDPLHDSTASLLACLQDNIEGEVIGLDADDRDAILDLLFATSVQPLMAAGKIVFIHDYPASQAALARLHADDASVAQRFEVFVNGIELGNGFVELTDSSEQRRRFQRDLVRREQAKKPAVPMDEHLLAALASGLPQCAGMAMGVDRLCMLASGADHIDQVLAFPWHRA